MIIIAILAAALVASVIVGSIAFLRVGIRREESDKSFLDEAPTRTAAVTRRVVGLYVRTPQRPAQDDKAHPANFGRMQRPPTAWTGR